MRHGFITRCKRDKGFADCALSEIPRCQNWCLNESQLVNCSHNARSNGVRNHLPSQVQRDVVRSLEQRTTGRGII